MIKRDTAEISGSIGTILAQIGIKCSETRDQCWKNAILAHRDTSVSDSKRIGLGSIGFEGEEWGRRQSVQHHKTELDKKRKEWQETQGRAEL